MYGLPPSIQQPLLPTAARGVFERGTGTAGVRCKDEEVHDTNIAHSAQGAYGLGVWGQRSLGSFGLDRVRGARVAGVVFWTCTARQPCRSGNAPLAVRGWRAGTSGYRRPGSQCLLLRNAAVPFRGSCRDITLEDAESSF